MTAKVINATGPWGAMPADWDHLTFVLGLTDDLLPVVSNPEAPISPTSKLASKGKVPSLYNGNGQVVGLAKWTAKRSTDAEIRKWRPISDYGICIQTRTVRALDVDVTDAGMAKAIKSRIAEVLGVQLPCRTRGNASKFLMVFEMPGDFPKRIIKTDQGNVEFLGTGQQFIAIGTHPSGVRYVWEQGLPNDIPVLDAAEFEAIWSILATEFGNGESTTMVKGRKGSGTGIVGEDPLGEYLDENGWTMADGRDGERHIRCPFEDGHSMGQAGDGSTTYFPPDAEYAQGHFKCLHGSCASRTRGEFIEAVGYQKDIFADLVAEVPDNAPEPLPGFLRDKSGAILATVDNVVKALRHTMCGMQLRFDQFKDEIVWSPFGEVAWRPFGDEDYVELRICLEKQSFKPIGRELIRDAVHYVAFRNKFDTAITWLDGLTWDGVPRVECFLLDYFGVEDTPYHRAVSRYLWSAMAGRVVQPGVKADMVPILVGAQGLKKSTAVAMMAPSMDFFCEISFHEKEQDLARKMRGRLLAEIGELRGLHTRELETIKAFITRTQEDWTPKFKEFNTVFMRRLVFIGTTNKEEFLADETGNRRWLPVKVSHADTEKIIADRNQLWAEGAVMFMLGGVDFKDAEVLSAEAHAEHTMTDAWFDAICKWLGEEDVLVGDMPNTRAYLRVSDVLKGALGFKDKDIKRADEMRAGSVLRQLGYSRKKMRISGTPAWAYVPSQKPAGNGRGNAEIPF
jgi:hypothetical protein